MLQNKVTTEMQRTVQSQVLNDLFLMISVFVDYITSFGPYRFFRKGVPGCEEDSVLWAPGVMMQTYHLCGRPLAQWRFKGGGVHLFCVFPPFSFLFLDVNKSVY